MADELAWIEKMPPALKPRAIERSSTDCVMDIKRFLVLDGIDILPDGFRVRTHDMYGQLPAILVI